MAYSWLVLALLLQGTAAPPATQSVTVAMPGAPVDLTVEWLRIGAGLAGGVEVTSTRTFPAGRPVTLDVTTGTDRYLRFSRANAAPLTVAVADVTAAKPYALPEAEPGGELVVAFETDGIIPSSLRLSGPRTTIRDRRGRAVMTIGGLPAGQYDLEPAYSSGIAGARQQFTVEAGRSTVFVHKRDAVGGLRISAAPETCAAAGDVVVSMDGPPIARGVPPAPLPPLPGGGVVGGIPPVRGGGPGPVSVINGIPRYTVMSYRTATGCDRLIDGLAAGRYMVSFNAQAGGMVGSIVVDVAPQQLVNAFVPAPPVQLSGTVLFNGKPAAGAMLSFAGRTPPGGPPPRVQVDADGRYNIALPATGDYTMSASFSETGGFGPHRTTLRLIEGKNSYDWNLTGGTITVLITGWDRRTPLRLSLMGPGMQSMSTYDGATFPIRLAGLPPGGYTVSASIMGVAAAREAKSVTIDATNTEVTVSLEMAANTNVLRVKDDTGAPVAGLIVSGLPIGRVVETSPGTYSLADVPPGTDLTVRPPAGYAATCNITSTAADSELVLARGRPVEMVFLKPTPSSVPPGVMVFGTGPVRCLVPMSRFQFTKLDSPPTESRFLIQNFPVGDKVTYQTTTEQREITVPASGPLIIR